MNELIKSCDCRNTVHKRLLATVSAVTLATASSLAQARDADQPTVWIELGGQMEATQGTTGAFVAPFMILEPEPDVYNGISFLDNQTQGRFAFGAEGKLTFQSSGSDWIFTAGVRYGRSSASRHGHKQLGPIGGLPITKAGSVLATKYFDTAPLADIRAEENERHSIVDFAAGKDIGLGLFGRSGESRIEIGVRIASFTSNSSILASARPVVNPAVLNYLGYGIRNPTYYQYNMSGAAKRSFTGIGPSLSWNASAALVGNQPDGELTFDWGVNVAILFGKQKATVSHSTQAYHQTFSQYHVQSYENSPPRTSRARSAVVPNLGGFAGLSARYPNAKVSLGYRADFFIGAMDVGIGARRIKDVGFQGPFANISIGLGG